MTSEKRRFPVFGSVFSKLIIVLLITGLLINIAVILFFKFGFSDVYRKPFRQNTIEHVYYLVEDLGSPPDPQQAEYVSIKSGFDIYYKSNENSWTTSNGTIPFDVLKEELETHHFGRHKFKNAFTGFPEKQRKARKRRDRMTSFLENELKQTNDPNKIRRIKNRLTHLKSMPVIKGGIIKKRLAVLYETENETIIFYKKDPFAESQTKAFLVLISFLIVTGLGAWFFIKKILKPIHTLTNGVEHVGRGNLSFRINRKSNDELGRLSGAFNEMTGQIDKMLRAKETLLIDISHELRSPVTRAKVAMEFLPESDARKSIQEDITEIETMINELLENARFATDHGKPEKRSTPVKKLLKEVVGSDSRYSEYTEIKNIPDALSLDLDPGQIKRVIRNILENAVKYSDKENPKIEILYREEKETAIIDIRDNGAGIPDDELNSIFEPFYRVDKSRSKKTGGYGLGLSLCKSIMEAHGGMITASSLKENGTIVSLGFPVYNRDF